MEEIILVRKENMGYATQDEDFDIYFSSNPENAIKLKSKEAALQFIEDEGLTGLFEIVTFYKN